MSWIRRVLRIGRKVAESGILETLAKSAKDLPAFRAAAAQAARRGDLDHYFTRLGKANARSDQWLDGLEKD